MSSFQALLEVIGGHGLFGSLYADRGSHFWTTAAIHYKLIFEKRNVAWPLIPPAREEQLSHPMAKRVLKREDAARGSMIADLAQSVAGRIAGHLERAILDGRFNPGDWLREVDLAKEFGVSRTPVREAFHMLETRGMLCIVPRKGVHVKTVTHQEMEALLTIRSALDGLAAQISADRMTPAIAMKLKANMDAQRNAVARKDVRTFEARGQDLHAVIYEMSGNPKLLAIYESLKVEGALYRIVGFLLPGEMQNTLKDHQRIVAALVARDGVAARVAAERHIMRALKRLRRNVPGDGTADQATPRSQRARA